MDFSPLKASLLVVSKTNTFNILLLKYSTTLFTEKVLSLESDRGRFKSQMDTY